MVLVDLRSKGIPGAVAEFILEEINIACNKNTVPGDKSALNPSGIRLGTPALTTRGMIVKDIEKVVEIIDKGESPYKFFLFVFYITITHVIILCIFYCQV